MKLVTSVLNCEPSYPSIHSQLFAFHNSLNRHVICLLCFILLWQRRWLFSLTSKVILCSGEELTALPQPMLCCVTSNSFLPPPFSPLPTHSPLSPRSRRRQRCEEKARPRRWGRRRRRWRRRLERDWKRAPTEFPPPPRQTPTSTIPQLPTAFAIHVCTKPAPSSLHWGKTVLDGWAAWNRPTLLIFLFVFFSLHLPTPPPTSHGTESHPTPSTAPTPHPTPVRGSQAAQHSAFHNFCRPLFMYSRVRTMGLVCSFWVCAFNMFFCWTIFFWFCFFEFIISLFRHFSVSFFFLPNKIFAIAAVQPASHGFFSVAACCTNQGCSYIFTFCMTKKNNFVNKMLTFCAFLSSCLHFPDVAFGLIWS